MKGSWVNSALIAAALAGLGVLAAAASLFGGVAWALARDVGLNCTFWCFLGPVGVGFAFAALLGESLAEWNRRGNAQFQADRAAGLYDEPLPGNDVNAVH